MNKNKNIILDISFSIILFLFLIFAFSNVGFLTKIPLNIFYVFFSFLFVFAYFVFRKNFWIKSLSFLAIFFLSFVFANFFIDTSFDGRCYHFTIEALLKMGFNPIYNDIHKFAFENNIFYNLLFASSYPNSVELIRANFYLLFSNMEAGKLVNYLFAFFGFFYSFYFFQKQNINLVKTFLLSFSLVLCSVSLCQMATRLVDFGLYYLFLAQIISIILIRKKKDEKINVAILIISTILALTTKYIGLFNSVIIFVIYFIFKIIQKEKLKRFLKITFVIVFSGLILGFQPYITNIVKFKNPFYPSVGYNKLDFMTKQNPHEFLGKPYLYKFFRSTFSSSSDSRMNNPQTLKLFWKIPFSSKYDLPFIGEELRISGFGHLYSGIFLLTIFSSLFLCFKLQKRRKEYFLISLIILVSVFLNPLCWWARFVAQQYLLSIFNCYYLFKNKNNILSYILIFFLMINGFWCARENFMGNAYRTYVMNSFYGDLYLKSQNKPILVNIDKNKNDEDDTSIIFRFDNYGINYLLTEDIDKNFKKLNSEYSFSQGYKIKIQE